MDYNIDDIDITELARNSPLMARLVKEVRLEKRNPALAYDRMHNRHNRTIRRPAPVRLPDPRPREEPPPEEPPPSESANQDK